MKTELRNHSLWTSYESLKYAPISGRYVHPYEIKSALVRFSNIGHYDCIGQSVLGKPIHSFTLGSGEYKILAWSQMHGNESTTTKAILDVINALTSLKGDVLVDSMLNNITLKVIPQLNPDGCEAYTRNNANDIDLNRDAKDLSQPESKVLREVFDTYKPELCLNLHDQRTIYNVSGSPEPATLSFLSPSANEERSVTRSRGVAMQYIASMVDLLQLEIPNKIGRYDDGFNINCVGDMFQSLGIPTILFEAGHHPNDYLRDVTRKYTYLALLDILCAATSERWAHINVDDYLKIPENDKKYMDVLFRNVMFNNSILDVGIQYVEELAKSKIRFIPVVHEIGDLAKFYGHREIDGSGKKLEINTDLNVQKGSNVHSIMFDGNNFVISNDSK